MNDADYCKEFFARARVYSSNILLDALHAEKMDFPEELLAYI